MLNRLRSVLVLLAVAVAAAPAHAASDSEALVVKAQLLMESLKTDPDFESMRRTMPEAEGIVIFPSLLKAGFIFGAEGGSGVLLARGEDGTWSHPSFFTLGAGSFGLQIGVQDAEVVFLLMNRGAVEAVIANEVKLGVDVGITAGPVGHGIEGSTTTNVDADIVAYSRAVGAFAGGAFEGAVVHERQDLAREYYGDASATARRIVQQRAFSNPHAEGLRSALASY